MIYFHKITQKYSAASKSHKLTKPLLPKKVEYLEKKIGMNPITEIGEIPPCKS